MRNKHSGWPAGLGRVTYVPFESSCNVLVAGKNRLVDHLMVSLHAYAYRISCRFHDFSSRARAIDIVIDSMVITSCVHLDV